MPRPLAVIGAPSSAGAFAPGQEQAPAALRRAGLVMGLREVGRTVRDDGDLPLYRWQPDREHPLAQHADRVVETVRAVAGRVRSAVAAGEMPVVLGGDCTIGVGTVAGHLDGMNDVGLVYFDMHADLNTPRSAPAGAFDWMGMAHLLGVPDTLEALARVGPSYPMLSPDQVHLFAHRRDQARPWEIACLDRLSLARTPLEDVARDPTRLAEQALAAMDSRWRRLLIHFDVDVIDFTDAPLSENTGRNIGLALDAAIDALAVFLRDPRTCALTITELNPDHGEPGGATIRRFVDGLVRAFHADTAA